MLVPKLVRLCVVMMLSSRASVGFLISRACTSIRGPRFNRSTNEHCFQRLFASKRADPRPAEWKLKKLHRKRMNDGVRKHQSSYQHEDTMHGLVVERLGKRLLVETIEQVHQQQQQFHYFNESTMEPTFWRCSMSQEMIEEGVVVGDTVEFLPTIGDSTDSSAGVTRKEDESSVTSESLSSQPLSSEGENRSGVVVGIGKRMNILSRPDATSNENKLRLKLIASNVDQLIIVVSAAPAVPAGSIDQYILIAEHAGIPDVVIAVNKADMPESVQLARDLQYYSKFLGHKVILTSATGRSHVPPASEDTEKESTPMQEFTDRHPGLSELLKIMENKTSIFVGQSGVGKSSLINVLLPDAKARVGGLVKKEKLGAHTTSNARLYHIHHTSFAPKISISDIQGQEQQCCSSAFFPNEVATSINIDAHSSTRADEASLQHTPTKETNFAQQRQRRQQRKREEHEGEATERSVDEDDAFSVQASPRSGSMTSTRTSVIDSPGIREMATWHLSKDDITSGFKEIAEYSKQCKFRNCMHSVAESEQGICAVAKAVEDGLIHPDRYASYKQLACVD